METESFVEVKEGSLVLLIFFDHFLPFSVCSSALRKRVKDYISSGFCSSSQLLVVKVPETWLPHTP